MTTESNAANDFDAFSAFHPETVAAPSERTVAGIALDLQRFADELDARWTDMSAALNHEDGGRSTAPSDRAADLLATLHQSIAGLRYEISKASK